MRRFRHGAALVLLGAACTIPTVVPARAADVEAAELTPAPVAEAEEAEAPAPKGPMLSVRAVEVEPMDGGRRVRIMLNRPAGGLRNFTMSDPPRLVIDLTGRPDPKDGREGRFALTDDVVSRARVAPFNGRLRVVLDLTKKTGRRTIRSDGASVVAEIADGEQATAAAEPVRTAPNAGNPAPAPIAAAAPAEPAPAAAPEAAPVAPPPVAAVPPPPPPVAATPPPAPVAATPPPAPPAVARAEKPKRAKKQVAEVEPVRAPADEPHGVSPAAYELAEPPPAAAAADAPAREASPPPPAEETEPVHVKRHASANPALSLVNPERAGFHGERISLDFKDADIQNVLRVIADVSQLNIIATDDVKGRVTLHLVDVPWDQALDLILHSNRLEKTQEGNVVRISTVARLKEEREALRAAQDAERELEPLRVRYVNVNYARADESLVDKVKGVLTDRGSVTFDDRTNTVIVRDIQRGVDDASELVRQLDTQSPQVLIEANIVEATEDFARGLGVQWGYSYKAGAATGNPTGFNFPGSVGLGGSGLGSGTPAPPTGGVAKSPVPFLADFPVPGNFGSGFGAGNGSAIDLALGSLDGVNSLSARLTALEEEGKGKVISRPRVVTMNNQAATIQSLTILRVKLPSTGTVINTGAGGAAGSATTATEKINTGITLVVTPQVSKDGYVLMSIYAKSSQPDFTHTVDNIPNEVSREANSNVLIRNGETVVLGGIFRNTSTDNQNGLPYLNRIPVLGWLFKRQLRSHHHEELLVFLTPKVVATGAVDLPPAERLWQERRHDG